MNLNLPGVILLGVGALFMYSAVKGGNPATVVRDALNKGKTVPKAGGNQVTPAPGTPKAGTGQTTPAPALQPFENRSAL